MTDFDKELAEAQEAIDQFYAACPMPVEIEEKMADLLEDGMLVRTGDHQADLVAAYALAIGAPSTARH